MSELYFSATELLQPFPLLFLGTWAALLYVAWRSPGLRRRLVLVSVPLALLTLLSLPAVAYLARGTLEWQYPPLHQRPADTQALVVLAGSIRPPDATHPQAELYDDTYYRCRAALELYRSGPPCPVLVSGGKVDASAPGPTCAEAMRTFLIDEGVAPADVLVEGESRTTSENAVRSAALLRERHLQRIGLVTEATHMPRAERCFRKEGVNVIPAPCDYQTPFRWSLGEFLPNPYAVLDCQRAGHEWLGALWYWCQGRF